MTTVAGNKLIAEFMGVKTKERNERPYGTWITYNVDGKWYAEVNLKYNTSWEWLMPALQKFCSIPERLPEIDNYADLIHEALSKFDKDAAWKIVCNGITWYNQQQKQP